MRSKIHCPRHSNCATLSILPSVAHCWRNPAFAGNRFPTHDLSPLDPWFEQARSSSILRKKTLITAHERNTP